MEVNLEEVMAIIGKGKHRMVCKLRTFVEFELEIILAHKLTKNLLDILSSPAGNSVQQLPGNHP